MIVLWRQYDKWLAYMVVTSTSWQFTRKKETINRMYGCVCARVLKQSNNDVDNNYDAITAGFFFHLSAQADWNDLIYYMLFTTQFDYILLHTLLFLNSHFSTIKTVYPFGLSVWFDLPMNQCNAYICEKCLIGLSVRFECAFSL